MSFFSGFPVVVVIIFLQIFTVKEVSEQSRELLRHALEEAQAEFSRKVEIIHEIRAIESLPRIRVRNFDDTVVSGGGCVVAGYCIITYVTVNLSPHVRPQAMTCWERCPWPS